MTSVRECLLFCLLVVGVCSQSGALQSYMSQYWEDVQGLSDSIVKAISCASAENDEMASYKKTLQYSEAIVRSAVQIVAKEFGDYQQWQQYADKEKKDADLYVQYATDFTHAIHDTLAMAFALMENNTWKQFFDVNQEVVSKVQKVLSDGGADFDVDAITQVFVSSSQLFEDIVSVLTNSEALPGVWAISCDFFDKEQ